MKIGFLIIARMKSTRLRHKALLTLAGRPMLARMHDRALSARRVDQIVLATSELADDDPIAEMAEREGIACFRGHPEDVVQRLHDAARAFSFDYILHIPGDSPLVDPGYCDRVVEAYERSGADLITTLDLPIGTFVYGLKPAALAQVLEIKDTDRSEVWGRYFTHTDLFHVEALEVDPAHRRPDLRLTIDYPEDFQVLEQLFSDLHRPGTVFGVDTIIAHLDAHPEIVALNAHCQQMYERRWLGQAEISLKKRHRVTTAALIGTSQSLGRQLENLESLGLEHLVAWPPAAAPTGCTSVSSMDELIALRPDVVLLDPRVLAKGGPSPNGAPDALPAALTQVLTQARGLLIDQPGDLPLASLDALLELTQANRTITWAGDAMQLHPTVLEVDRQLSSGRLGAPRLLQMTSAAPTGRWQALAAEIDLATAWLGDATQVAAAADAGSPVGLMIRHSDGSLSQLHLDSHPQARAVRGTLLCEKGSIRFDLAARSVVLELAGEPSAAQDRSSATATTTRTSTTAPHPQQVMATFLRFVREGRVRHDHDLATGRSTAAVISAALESILTEAWAEPPGR